MDYDTVVEKVHEIFPELVEGLKDLIRIPSVATDGFPAEPVIAAHDRVVELLREAGVTDITDIRLEGKTGPVINATVPGPEGAPTVLFYTHYDVVPAGEESEWETAPFEPVEKDGAIYGRGSADSKVNIMGIIGMLRVLDGKPPVTLRIVVEGQEEYGSDFDFFPPTRPDIFESDAMVIADVGSVRPGFPSLTTALRGSASVTISCHTLESDKHSGSFGGAAPDARIAIIRALSSLFDEHGNVAVPGLLREPWTGVSYDDAEFRDLAEILDGVPIVGSGDIGSRIWSGPAISVIGFDAPSASAPINAVASSASAVINVRTHPTQPAVEAQEIVMDFLRELKPFGIELTVTAGDAGDGFRARTDGPAFAAASAALSAAWGLEPGEIAIGGSIPIVMSLDQAVPNAEKLLFGITDGHANIHGPNERVLMSEFENGVVAKVLFVQNFAQATLGAG